MSERKIQKEKYIFLLSIHISIYIYINIHKIYIIFNDMIAFAYA